MVYNSLCPFGHTVVNSGAVYYTVDAQESKKTKI